MKSTKIFFLFFALALSGQLLHAQIKISGTIYSSTLDPVVGATVEALAPDSSLQHATTTNANGHFALSVGRAGILRISHLTYNTYMVNFGQDTSIIASLTDKTASIEEVVVTAKRPVIEMKDGNIVVNIAQIPMYKTQDISKILGKLPGVTASEREGLTVNGQTATLYIDGVKQQLSGSKLIKLLQSLPAETVDQVELNAVATGREGADESGAVISISTQKNQGDGQYLYTTLQGAYMKGAGAGTDLFYMVRKNRITLNTSLSYSNKYVCTTTTTTARSMRMAVGCTRLW